MSGRVYLPASPHACIYRPRDRDRPPNVASCRHVPAAPIRRKRKRPPVAAEGTMALFVPHEPAVRPLPVFDRRC